MARSGRLERRRDEDDLVAARAAAGPRPTVGRRFFAKRGVDVAETARAVAFVTAAAVESDAEFLALLRGNDDGGRPRV